MIKKLMVIALGVGCITALVVGAGAVRSYQWLHSEISFTQGQELVTVERGMSLSKLAHTLNHQKLIAHPKVWVLYARFVEPVSIKAGEYQLTQGMTPLELLKIIQRGDVITYSVTLVEGEKTATYESKLSATPKLVNQLAAMTQSQKLAYF